MFNPQHALQPDDERAAGEVIDGEAIVINLATGVYYSMEGIGGEIWSMIESGLSAAAIVESVAALYEVEPDTARRDVEGLLTLLAAEKLIRVRSDVIPSSAIAGVSERRAYTAPVLRTYRDMEDLLALDPPAPGMSQIAWKEEQAD